MWLKNEHDVVLHLKAKREGVMLAVGADAIKIRLEGVSASAMARLARTALVVALAAAGLGLACPLPPRRP